MNVASLGLCKTLFELSGWEGPSRSIWAYSTTKEEYWELPVPADELSPECKYVCPAYDLGYLLRKVPNRTDIDEDTWERAFDCTTPESFFLAWEMDTLRHGWRVQMQVEDEVMERTLFEADTPEDAVCKLAIELFKQGILTRDGDA